MRLAIGALALVACYSPGDIGRCTVTCSQPSDCPSGFDACSNGLCATTGTTCTADPPPDVPAGESCAGSADSPLGVLCYSAMPEDIAGSVTIQFDTDTNLKCMPSSSTKSAQALCVLAVQSISAEVRFVGSKPIVLWSPTNLAISGSVDASSTADDKGTAGDFASCPVGVDGFISVMASVGSGGAGGSYGGLGGAGGPVPASGTSGGSASLSTLSAGELRGGCRGGNGGPPTAGTINASSGHGGGVVYLVAGDQVVVTETGRVNASGGGARPAINRGGGGGGGSGGQIVFDAPSIVITKGTSDGIVLSLGGGGGSGGSNGAMGNPGSDPTFSFPFNAGRSQADSGCNASDKSFGGAGSLGDDQPAENGADTAAAGCGAGGGGGGDGLIDLYGDPTPVMTGIIHPMATIH